MQKEDFLGRYDRIHDCTGSNVGAIKGNFNYRADYSDTKCMETIINARKAFGVFLFKKVDWFYGLSVLIASTDTPKG